jgi:hypothetical protein
MKNESNKCRNLFFIYAMFTIKISSNEKIIYSYLFRLTQTMQIILKKHFKYI